MFMCGEEEFISLEFDPASSKLDAFDSEGVTIPLEFKKNGDIKGSSLKALEAAISKLSSVEQAK